MLLNWRQDLSKKIKKDSARWVELCVKSHLRQPVDAVLSRHRQHVQNLREPCEARDPENGSPCPLRQTSQKTDVPEVIRPQFIP